MSKHSTQTLPRPVSDYVKIDSYPHLRIPVEATTGTQAFTFVDYLGCKLLALTPEENGSVLVQPNSCVISLKYISDDVITKAGGLLRVVTDGATRNITYLDKHGNTIVASALDGYEPLSTDQPPTIKSPTIAQDYTQYLAEWMLSKSDDELRTWLETKGVTDKPQSRNEIAKVIYDNNLQNESMPSVIQDYTQYLAEWMRSKSDDELRTWLETKGVTDKPQSRNEIAKVIYDNNLQNESMPSVIQDYTQYLAEWMRSKSDDELRTWLETKGVTDKPQSRNEIAKVIYDNNLQNESLSESVSNEV